MNTTTSTGVRHKPYIFSGHRGRQTQMWKRVNTDLTGNPKGTGAGLDNKMNAGRYHATRGTVNTNSGWDESSGDSDDC